MAARGGRTRYALVGVGALAQLYTHAIVGEHRAACELVGLCDLNGVRLAHQNALLAAAFGSPPVPCYPPDGFEQMLSEQRVDCVIVATVDATHADYIVRALEAGCDVVCEKPLATTATDARRVCEAVQRTGRNVRICFNYRYSPRNAKVKELLAGGAIGEVRPTPPHQQLDTPAAHLHPLRTTTRCAPPPAAPRRVSVVLRHRPPGPLRPLRVAPLQYVTYVTPGPLRPLRVAPRHDARR